MCARIEPLLPSSQGLRGGWWSDHRTVIEGTVWRYRTGSPRRDVLECCGPRQTLWKRHDRWAGDGTWDRLLTELSADADAAGDLDWVVSVDSSINRAHQHAAGARRVLNAESDEDTGGSIE
jgi:transposase